VQEDYPSLGKWVRRFELDRVQRFSHQKNP
jgi:hypothetical protein